MASICIICEWPGASKPLTRVYYISLFFAISMLSLDTTNHSKRLASTLFIADSSSDKLLAAMLIRGKALLWLGQLGKSGKYGGGGAGTNKASL